MSTMATDSAQAPTPEALDERIAIVGFAGRFPGGYDAQSLWPALLNGTELHHTSSDEELLAAGRSAEEITRDELVRRRPLLVDPEDFDAALFGYSAAEAATCDPQQRIFLEVAWSAFEHAGIDPSRFDGVTGVYAGGGPDTYVHSEVLPKADPSDPTFHMARVVGNERDFLAPRLAYKLGTSGPALTVISGCATSLVAVHLASQSLLSGETDMCLAGGVTIFFPQRGGYFYHKGGIVSPDGRCRPFSASAAGTVTGDAAACVILRRLGDAQRDGDTVYGVITGSAVNNDGSDKVGFTAPSVSGQAAVVAEALAVAGLEPGDIDYVETHGTATAIGDGIEVEALNHAYQGAPAESCHLSAMKPVIGHTDAAAGASALVKVLLSLQHGKITPIGGFDSPHPDIDFGSGPTKPADRAVDWIPDPRRPRRAGVSAFSIGGTNCHLIVEESPSPEHVHSDDPEGSSYVVPLSAATHSALDQLTEHTARALDNTSVPRASVASTFAQGRRQLPYRRGVVLSPGEPASNLIERSVRHPASRASAGEATVFLFPGQGSQYPGMGADLYRDSRRFRAALDDVLGLCEPEIRRTMRHELLTKPTGGFPRNLGPRETGPLSNTALTQPALFAVEYASARALCEVGATPDALLGHSLGEFPAAVMAGVMSLEDAVTAVTARGQLLSDTFPGAMAAIAASQEIVTDIVDAAGASIAAVNTPRQTVISGTEKAIRSTLNLAERRGLRATQLRVNRGFHSSLLDGVVEPMRQVMAGITLSPPNIPLARTATGSWWTGQDATSPDVWARQLRETVRFADAVSTVASAYPDALWVESGPGNALSSSVRSCGQEVSAFSVLGRPDELPAPEGTAEASLVATLWEAGLNIEEIEGDEFFGGASTTRAELPGYPFQHRRYRFGDLAEGLPGFSDGRPGGGSEYVAPRDEREEHVASSMARVLGLESAGMNDDFFSLGGDSLAATRLAHELSEHFGLDVGVGHVMSPPATPATITSTVEDLAAQAVDHLSDEEVEELLTGDR